MSRENVKKFCEALAKDENLVKKLNELNEALQEKNLEILNLKKIANEKIILLAKEKGFDFTSEELDEYRKDLRKNLSEEDLMSITGGMQPRTAALLLSLTLGTTAVAGSVVNMLSNTATQNQATTSISAPIESKKPDKISPIESALEANKTEADSENQDVKDNQENTDELQEMRDMLKNKEISLPEINVNNNEQKADIKNEEAKSEEGQVGLGQRRIRENTVKREEGSSPVVKKDETPIVKMDGAIPVVAHGTILTEKFTESEMQKFVKTINISISKICLGKSSSDIDSLRGAVISDVKAKVEAKGAYTVSAEGENIVIKNNINNKSAIINITEKIKAFFDSEKILENYKNDINNIVTSEEQKIIYRKESLSRDGLIKNIIDRIKDEVDPIDDPIKIEVDGTKIKVTTTDDFNISSEFDLESVIDNFIDSLDDSYKIGYTSYKGNLWVNTATNQANNLLNQLAGVEHFNEVKKEDRAVLKSDLKDLVKQIAEKTKKGNTYSVLDKGLNYFDGTENLVIVSNGGREQNGVSSDNLHKIIRLYRESLDFSIEATSGTEDTTAAVDTHSTDAEPVVTADAASDDSTETKKEPVSYTAYGRSGLLGWTATAQANDLLTKLKDVEHFNEVRDSDRDVLKDDLEHLVAQIAVDDESNNLKKVLVDNKLEKLNDDDNLVIMTNWSVYRDVQSEDLHKIVELYRESLES